MASPSFSWLKPSMLRRSRTREPTWMSIGFGLSPFRRPGRRVCCCIAIFGRSPSQRQRIKLTEYTIVLHEQPTQHKRNHHDTGLLSAVPRRTLNGPEHSRDDRERADQQQRDKGPITSAGIECGRTWGWECDIGVANRVKIDA